MTCPHRDTTTLMGDDGALAVLCADCGVDMSSIRNAVCFHCRADLGVPVYVPTATWSPDDDKRVIEWHFQQIVCGRCQTVNAVAKPPPEPSFPGPTKYGTVRCPRCHHDSGFHDMAGLRCGWCQYLFPGQPITQPAPPGRQGPPPDRPKPPAAPRAVTRELIFDDEEQP